MLQSSAPSTRSMRLTALGIFLLTLVIALPTSVRAQSQDLKFDSSDALLRLGNAPELIPQFAFTVETWLRYSSTSSIGGLGGTIFRASSYGPVPLFFYVSGSRQLGLQLKSATATTTLTSTATIMDFGWSHVAATWDGATISLYIDGNPSGSLPFNGPLLDDMLECFIGGQYNATSSTWKGRMDEFRIWNYARSQTEINATMNQQLDHNEGLVAAWHFNGDFNDETGGHLITTLGSCSLLSSTSPVNPLQLQAPGRAQVNTTIDFRMRGTPPGSPYFLDNSFAGTSVGTPLTAPLVGTFPLNSPLLNLTYGPAAPGVFDNYMGITNSAGEATASFDVPDFGYLYGLQMQSAFLYLTSLNPMVLGEISQVISTDFKLPAPTVGSIYPSAGPQSQAWPVTIFGQGFQTAPTILVGGIAATNVVLQSPSIISCDFPPSTSLGTKNVTLIFPGEAPIYLESAYSYLKDLVITSLTPEFANPGDSVVLKALGVEVGATIDVATIPAAITSFTLSTNSESTIVFTMPSGAPCQAPVRLKNLDGRSDSVVINPGPFIATTIGAQGPMSGGTTFYIVGGNFDAGVQVAVSGLTATLISTSTSTLAVISPPGSIGAAPVIVTNGDGCTVTTSFLYQ